MDDPVILQIKASFLDRLTKDEVLKFVTFVNEVIGPKLDKENLELLNEVVNYVKSK